MGSDNKGLTFGGLIFMIVLVIVIVVMALVYYDKIDIGFDFGSIKEKFTGKADEVILSQPPANYDWCKIQEMEDSEIIGWSTDYKACIQQWKNWDTCLQKESTIIRAFIGDVGTIVRFGRINGYYLEIPRDYEKFIPALSEENTTETDKIYCQSLIYPSNIDQELNIANNFEVI
jgi:hypothetical protein